MRSFDFVVIGSGPSGVNAALQAASEGRSVAVVEEHPGIGGSCVHHGTIPSKSLREHALQLVRLHQRRDGVRASLESGVTIRTLLGPLDEMIASHERTIGHQLEREGIEVVRGRARFATENELSIDLGGRFETIGAEHVIIATGSRPRHLPAVPVDHSNIVDSDSILRLNMLPASLLVLGGGVIACEYASIFAALGVDVTILDRSDRPLAFLDPELSDRFVGSLQRLGARYLGGSRVERAESDIFRGTIVRLESGEELVAEKTFCAFGRIANVGHLGLDAVGIALSDRGQIPVDADMRTGRPRIYAVGDVAGPPALASAAMEQGRRAVRHALGLPGVVVNSIVPAGIYAVPEIGAVGEDEPTARARVGDGEDTGILVGRADFAELARGQISGATDGLLKMVADLQGRLLGVQAIGDGATELVHLGQLALVAGWSIDAFLDNVFNFPTMAEAYRVAALDIQRQRQAAPVSSQLSLAVGGG